MITLKEVRANYKTFVPVVLPSIILLPLVIIVGWFVLFGWDKIRTVTYVIPPGTNARLAGGKMYLTSRRKLF